MALRTLPGIGFLKVFYTSYGCQYQKPTGFLHTVRGLNAIHRERPEFPATMVLRGRVLWLGEYVFRTWLAQPYPPALADDIAGHAVPAMQALRSPSAGDLWLSLLPGAEDLHDLPVQVPAWARMRANSLNVDALLHIRASMLEYRISSVGLMLRFAEDWLQNIVQMVNSNPNTSQGRLL